MRRPIADSWRRSFAAGVDPTPQGSAPLVADDDEAAARWEVHPLITVAPLIRECLAGIADDAAHLMVVSDADGTLLWLEGAPSVRLAAANSMNFAVGALWSESGAGTNAIGTALAADHAVQVFAAEHFNEVVQAWTCAAAPVHDPDTGRLLGVIDLTSKMSTVHPHSFAVAVATAGAVEAHLRCLMHEHDARLRSRYRDRVLTGGDDRALVTSSGRVIATNPAGWMPEERLELPAYGGEFTLPSGAHAFAEPLDRDGAFLIRRLEHAPAGSGGVAQLRLLGDDRPSVIVDGLPVPLGRRQAEILALLVLRPGGMTTEQLGAEIYGDDASNSTVRGEVSRLRTQVGIPIETEPYRLAGHVESDLGRVRALLLRGAVAGGGGALRGAAAAALRRARGRARAHRAGELAAPRGDVGRGSRRAVGVAADAVWAGRSGRLEARALGARFPRSAAQPGGRAGRAAARRHAPDVVVGPT